MLSLSLSYSPFEEVHVYAILHVLKDGHPVEICFSDTKSAKSFLRLVSIYVDDSGAGNGYSAYWPNYEGKGVLSRFLRPRRAITELDAGMIEKMLWSIYVAHAADIPEEMKELFSIGRAANGTATFSLKELPPRIRPTVGDMYRIPRSLSPDGICSEGRVIEDHGDTLTVIQCQYWEREGFRFDVQVEKVASSRAMKIRDWLKSLFPERTTWTFDPATIHAKP